VGEPIFSGPPHPLTVRRQTLDLLARDLSRRDVLKAMGFTSLAAFLAACGSSSVAGSGRGVSGTVKLQSNDSDAIPKKALASLVAAYEKARPSVTVNISTIDHNTFQQDLNNYLTASQPPDVLTWFAGERVRYFAGLGLLADLTSAFNSIGSGYTAADKALSSLNGTPYIMPNDYYWWGFFYKKSTWQAKGYNSISDFQSHSTPPSWQAFINLCKQMQKDGLTPITATDADGWPAGGWFDYFDLRVNGYDYHEKLLGGQGDFTDSGVTKVFQQWQQVLPYCNSNQVALKWQDAATPLIDGTAGMYMLGTQIIQLPNTVSDPDDYDFFPFPTIDPSVAMSTEAPTDGWIVSAKAQNMSAVLDLIEFFVKPPQVVTYCNETGGILPVLTTAPSPTAQININGLALIHASASLSQFFDRDSSPAFSQNGYGDLQSFLENPVTSNISTVQKSLQTHMRAAAGS
jgi:multiple sugar transport system substrate-binding protein